MAAKWFCRECGTRVKALHWPDDDYRCPNEKCKYFDVEVDSLQFIQISRK